MEYQALLNSIKRGVLGTVYLFHGTENLLMNQSIEKIKNEILPPGLEAFNFDKLDGTKVPLNQVVELASMMPVMAEKRLIIIDSPPYFLASKGNEAKVDESVLLQYLENPNPNSCLIFKVLGKVDKRKKIYKAIAKNGQICEFTTLKGKFLEEWIKNFLMERDKRIEPKALMYLTIIGSGGLNILENELEKLVLYSSQETVISLDTVQNIVTKTSEVNVFNLIDSIANKESKKAIELLHTTLLLGEPPLKLVYLLVRQFRIILTAKDLISEGYSEKQVKEKIAAHPYVISKALVQGRKFSLTDLVRALEKLLEIETLLKSSGGDPGELLEDFIIKVGISDAR